LVSVRWLLWVGAAALALVIIVPFFRGDGTRVAGPAGMTGAVAPVLDLRDDRGEPVSIASYRGKIVVLNLWATWCPPCRAEMPDLSRLSGAYAHFGVVVVGVDQGESPERAASFARSLRISYPIWIDDEQRYGRTFTALGLPTTVFIGRDGVVAQGFDGALTYRQMQDALEPLLARS
jgi:thiol-disulfide isomerase/thioredoxin